MNDPKTLSKASRIAVAVFLFCLMVFLISLVPISYSVGYSNGLTGGAGLGADPNAITENSSAIGLFNYYVGIASGVIGSLALTTSAFANARKAKLEHAIEEMKYKTTQVQYEMQMKEIDKLRLELEAEKLEKAKRKLKH